MAFKLRWFQQEANDAAIEYIRKCTEPGLIEAATGAGKSVLVAEIARIVHEMSGKGILCLAPSAELVTQNREKFLETGYPANLYSASAGGKSLRHPITFGSPLTVIKVAKMIAERIALILVDEAHGLTDTVLTIIRTIQEHNPKVRVIGLTATPYRLGEGYIYRMGIDGKPVGDEKASNPFFAKLIYQIKAPTLIEQRYLTPPQVGVINAQAYETAGIILQANNKYADKDVDQAFVGQGRKTAAIIADVVEQAKGRRGVMIFAATTQHAQEIMESLPPALSRMVSGDPKITSKDERRKIIKDFKAQKFKYLVNVAVLTTGFDASHVDLVVFMRLTESAALLQQMIGRGLRLHITAEQARNWDSYTIAERERYMEEGGKPYVLLLDYAGNFQRHFPEGDLFDPNIKAGFGGAGSGTIDAKCPICKTVNTFSARNNPEGYAVNDEGYFADLEGNVIDTDFGPMPAHHGRRCQYERVVPGMMGKMDQCGYRWTFKPCPTCGEANDIAARYCSVKECRAEIIDPNEKLALEFKTLKRDPKRRQCDPVESMDSGWTVSRTGKDMLKVNLRTTHRKFTIWLDPKSPITSRQREWMMFDEATEAGKYMPDTVEYQKMEDGFYRVFSYNQPHDELETV